MSTICEESNRPQVAETVEPSALLDVRAVAQRLDCSTRHVLRMADGGRMPPPVRLGALVRWRREELEQWLAKGCPPVRRPRRQRKEASQ